MTHAATFEDVWAMIRETTTQLRETAAFVREMSEKADRRNEETTAQIKETGMQMKETDMQMKATDMQMKETDKKIKEVSTLVGNLGGRWGEFVEGLIAPSCIAMFTERGIQVDEVYSRVKKTIAGERMEIDLLVANTVAAVLVEVKSELQVEDVRIHLKRLQRFKSFFPRYAACQVYGAVAGIVIDSSADQFAINQGLFVIAQSGDTVHIANDAAFVPRTW
ncbi:MAG: ATP-binding protein [Magnetococcales bacterium]|nr:ATP-binding protein [Magnetococcales bacterium]